MRLEDNLFAYSAFEKVKASPGNTDIDRTETKRAYYVRFKFLVDRGKARKGCANCRPASSRYPVGVVRVRVLVFCAFGFHGGVDRVTTGSIEAEIANAEVEGLVAAIPGCPVLRSYADVDVEAAEPVKVCVLAADVELRLLRQDLHRLGGFAARRDG